eukprot:7842649-Pyramimonas_sp.AAC.1
MSLAKDPNICRCEYRNCDILFLWWNRMRTAPRRPSVELPMGPRNAVLDEGDACGLRHGDL